jgi:hypothetical protein
LTVAAGAETNNFGSATRGKRDLRMKKAERTRRKGKEDEKGRREEKEAVKGKIRKGMLEICLCVTV